MEITYRPTHAFEETPSTFGDASGAKGRWIRWSRKSRMTHRITGNDTLRMPEIMDADRVEVLNPSSRIGGVFGMLAIAEQRLRSKSLHYGSWWSVGTATVILGGGWGGNCSLSWLIRSCSSGSGWV
jgi:hypothetical protein